MRMIFPDFCLWKTLQVVLWIFRVTTMVFTEVFQCFIRVFSLINKFTPYYC